MKNINKNKEWLIKEINKNGYRNIDDLFLVLCNNDKLTIYDKNYKVSGGVLE